MDKKAFRKHFQYLIYKGLVFRATNQLVTGTIAIKRSFYDELKELGLTGRLKPATDLVTQFELRSFFINGDFCFAIPDDFKVKVGNQKKIRANGSIHESGCFTFSFRFRRHYSRNQTME
jgi:hypothetical protein